jgi:hypothetical protein
VGIGISLSPTSGSGIYVSSGKCTETQNTTKTTHTPSTVIARDKLTIKSGRDTNIIGSQVQGDRVEAQVGGNLNLESQQDTETYKEKSAQASVNIGVGTTTVGASGGKMTSDYSSVTGQAGIYAGKAGFDITVKGNTDLKGAVIDSKASSENKLTTGTITYSDIKNEAEYDAKGVGLSYDSVATNDENEKLGNKGVIPAIPMGAGEKDSSTTRSAVAPGTIEIRDKDKQKQDIAGLSRDTDNTLNKLDPIFDKDKVRERQELAGLFSELAFKQIHDMKNCSDEQRAILHSAVGLVSAALAKTNLPANALAAGANELVVQTLMNKVKVKVNGVEQPYFAIYPDQLQWLSGILGGLVSGAAGGNVGAGASTAASGTKNNMLSLTQLEAYLKELNDKAISRNSSGAILDTYGSYKATNDEQQIDLIEAMKDPDYCARLDKALEENPDLTEFEGIVVYGKDINSKEFIDARIPENRQAIIDRETILCDEIAKNIVTSIPVGGEAYLKQKAVNANNVKSLSSTPMFQALRKAGMAVDVIVFGGTIYTDLTTYDDWRDKTIAVVCDASAIGFSRAGGMAFGSIAGSITTSPVGIATGAYVGCVCGGVIGTKIANDLKNKYINIRK